MKRIVGTTAVALVLAGATFAHFFAAPPAKAPLIVERDGMMWIPGGQFLMGSDHKLAQENERPAHRVKVEGFWMDRHHVTTAEFRKFVDATGYLTIDSSARDIIVARTRLMARYKFGESVDGWSLGIAVSF